MARVTNQGETVLMARRLWILFGVAAYVAIALGSSLDRLAVWQPGLAGLVPAPLAAAAHRTRAAEALQKLDQAGALREAQSAVSADPVDLHSAALLGAASLLSRQPVQADRAFRVAARLGWRDPLTQLHFMNQALRSGETELAALRLDAVLRQNPLFPKRDMALSQFGASQEGRSGLARRLALRPPWTSQFMGKDSRLPLTELRTRAAILTTMQSKRWGCDAIAPLVNRLVEAGDAVTAKRLWSVHCPDASPTLADPDFARMSALRTITPFDWNLVGAGDVTVEPATPNRGGLNANVSGAASRKIAWQLLTLSSGTYSLHWIAREPDGTPARVLSLSLSCDLGKRNPLPTSLSSDGHFKAEFKVNQNCTNQYLAVWLSPISRLVHIESIHIEPQQ